MIRDIDRHFLKTDQSNLPIFVDIGVYENETAYNRVCVIGGYNQLVELEGLEPSSKRGTNELSTCVFPTWFSAVGRQGTANRQLSPFVFRTPRGALGILFPI